MPRFSHDQVDAADPAVALSDEHTLVKELAITALPENAATVFIGSHSGTDASNGWPLSPDGEFVLGKDDAAVSLPVYLDEVFVFGDSGTIAWVATPA